MHKIELQFRANNYLWSEVLLKILNKQIKKKKDEWQATRETN